MRKPLYSVGGDVTQSSHYEYQATAPQKLELVLLWGSALWCPGTPQRYLKPQVYCCAVHRSQQMKPAEMSIPRGMSRGKVGQLHRGTDSAVKQNWHHRRVVQWEIITQNQEDKCFRVPSGCIQIQDSIHVYMLWKQKQKCLEDQRRPGRERREKEWGMRKLYQVQKYSFETHPDVLQKHPVRNNNDRTIHQH